MMMTMRHFGTGAVLAALMTVGGCLFEPYRESTRFDPVVAPAETPVVGVPVAVAEFRNNSSSGVRMQFRDASGTVTTDPYNSWILPPGELAARALTQALNTGRETGEPRFVNGALVTFEVRTPERVFHLAGAFSTDGGRRFTRFDIAERVEGDSASAVSAAAAAAIGKLAKEIAASLRSGRP